MTLVRGSWVVTERARNAIRSAAGGEPFISALITLDPEMLPTWLANNGLPGDMSLKDAAANPKVREEVQRAIDIANKSVSRAESIRKFTVLTDDFTIENDLLTPSMKVKRGKVLDRYRSEIEALYAGGRAGADA